MDTKILGIILLLWISSIKANVEDGEKKVCSMASSAAASRRFSYALFNTASSRTGRRRNILLSSLSLGMSLSMVSSGAAGWSRLQILKVLEQGNGSELTMNSDCILRAYHSHLYNTQFLFKDPHNTEDTATLRTATRLYGEKTLHFAEQFVLGTSRYGVEMDVVPFADAPKYAERLLNIWVASQTDNTIKQMIKPGTLGSDTTLIMNCAMFFKGAWDIPFNIEGEDNFYLQNGRRRRVNYMTSGAPVRYLSSDELKAKLLEIPYASPDGSNVDARLILILPNEGVPIRTVEKDLRDDVIQQILQSDVTRDIRIHVPKFELFGDHKMKFYLKIMGIREIFHEKRAKLHGTVYEDENDKRIVHVGHVQHKARFQIDEHGSQGRRKLHTTANDSVVLEEQNLKFERPFIFILYDKFTENIIYIGRLTDPSKKVL